MRSPQPVVLVVEDDPLQSDLLREILACDGYRVESVADGAAAVGRVEAGGVDLVLLDVGLPRFDGVAVCQRIRSIQAEGRTQIVMVSALAAEALQQTGIAAGADDYLVKPFDIDDLLTIVARYCG